MNARRRALGILPLVAVLALIAGCDPGPQSAEPTDTPEIDVWINAAGDDSVDVYLLGPTSDRLRIAEGVAEWLGFPNTIAHEHDFYPDVSTVQLADRLIDRAGDEWFLRLDTGRLRQTLDETGYDSAMLALCVPVVETRLRATRAADVDPFDTGCTLEAYAWTISTSAAPIRIEMTFLPEVASYLAYGAGILLAAVVLGALAWWVANKLRSGSFRQRSAASVAIGLVGGILAAIGAGAFTAAIGATAGPADNLALARDMTSGGYTSALLFPALVATTPGIIFLTTLVRRRPGDEDEARAGLVPPGPPGPPAPPPLPWTAI